MSDIQAPIKPKTRFGSATRDFIPAGEAPTAAELNRQKQLRAMGAGRVRMDFIPAEDHELKEPSGREAQGKEAIERSLAAQASAAREMWDGGVRKLQGLNVSQTIEAITQAPYAVMEMYLAIEMKHGQRKSVLDRFPALDPAVVARWEEVNSGAPIEASEGTDTKPKDAKEQDNG